MKIFACCALLLSFAPAQDSRSAALADLRAQRAAVLRESAEQNAALEAEVAVLRAEVVVAVEAARAAESAAFSLAGDLEVLEYRLALEERDAETAEAEAASWAELFARREVSNPNAGASSRPTGADVLSAAAAEAKTRRTHMSKVRLAGETLVVGDIQSFVEGEGGVYGRVGLEGPLGGPFAPEGFEALKAALARGETAAWFPLDPSGRFRPASIEGVGGWIASGGPVMFGILALGFVGLVVAAARATALWRAGADAAACRKRAERWIAEWGIAGEPGDEVADRVVARAEDLFHRGRSSIAAVAAVAPLLGLLGTVTGMIKTFDALARSGGGDASALSGGIAEALTTTEAGLCVAIPALLIHAALGARARRLVDATEDAAEAIVMEGGRVA